MNDIAEKERNKVKQRAADISKYFSSLCSNGEKSEKQKTPVQQKEDRYRDYVKNDMVRIEEYGHALYGEWVKRSDAKGLNIHDPEDWLKNREKQKVARIGMSKI